MEKVRRYRAMGSLCRQSAVLNPLNSWKLLGDAERWERVAFLKAPKSDARRDNSVVSAGVLRSISVNPKNSAMRADEEIPASIM